MMTEYRGTYKWAEESDRFNLAFRRIYQVVGRVWKSEVPEKIRNRAMYLRIINTEILLIPLKHNRVT